MAENWLDCGPDRFLLRAVKHPKPYWIGTEGMIVMLNKDDWWGYSEEHGWVVLDRTLPGNSFRTGKMQFMRCRDWTTYIEDGKNWDPPRYLYAPNFIASLSVEKQAQAKSEFEWLVEQWTPIKEEIKKKEGKPAKKKKNRRTGCKFYQMDKVL